MKRVSVMMDDEIDRKLRNLQAHLIRKDNKSYSYSQVLNLVVKQGLKNN